MTRIKAGPNFICVGPHKTGTGWLYNTLNQHREVYPIFEKEIRYYTRLDFKKKYPGKLYLGRIKRAVRWLTIGRLKLFYSYLLKRDFWNNKGVWLRFFKDEIRLHLLPYSMNSYKSMLARPEGLICGDISPSYATMDVATISKIKDDFPDVKIILLIREPLSRIWSHVNMILRMKRLDPTVKNINWALRKYAYTDDYKSYPYDVTHKWKNVFGDENLLVAFYDDLIADPILFYKNICLFLGISDDVENNVLCASEPYRIGHLHRAPPKFESPIDVIYKKWKKGGELVGMDNELKIDILSDIYEQVNSFQLLMHDRYSKKWLCEYDVLLGRS